MTKTIQQLSVDAQIIYERLKKATVGELITYAELSELIKQNIQQEARKRLDTARKKALREDDMVFATVIGQGVKRISDEENALTTGPSTIKRIRREASRGLKRLAAVKNFDSMSHEAQIRHNMAVCVMGAFRQASHKSRINKIENELHQKNEKLAISKTLEFFK